MDLLIDAEIKNIEVVTNFVNDTLESLGVETRKITQIDIALDELMSNVCHYAYGEDVGKMRVSVEEADDGNSVQIVITDKGVPFNPLHRVDPDVTLGIDERQIGGLGIFMVKKIMDDISYRYEDGRNILTVLKRK